MCALVSMGRRLAAAHAAQAHHVTQRRRWSGALLLVLAAAHFMEERRLSRDVLLRLAARCVRHLALDEGRAHLPPWPRRRTRQSGTRRHADAGLHGTETRRRTRRTSSPRHTAMSVERSPPPRACSRTPHGGAPTGQRLPPQTRREMCAPSRTRRGTSAPPSLASHGQEAGGVTDDSAHEEDKALSDVELPEEEDSTEHSSSEGVLIE